MILRIYSTRLGEDLIKYDIEQTVYDLEYAKELSDIALNMNKKAKIHIALDTGMGRIGFIPNEKALEDVLEIVFRWNRNCRNIYSFLNCR